MPFRDWLGNLLRPRTQQRNRPRGKPVFGRPRLEHLETRNLLSAFRLGSTGSDTALSVKLDGAGNEYVCGTLNGTVDFDPGAGTSNLTASANGAISVRLPRSVHAALLAEAQAEGVSLNQLCLSKLVAQLRAVCG